MKKPVLVIMAAGIGSRYGAGVKQLAKVGPSGELVIDYSLYDAREAGFETVIFIIRKDIEADFRQLIGDRVEQQMHVSYAYQDPEDLPAGFCKPVGRRKPWGTGHAVLACRGMLDGPFAVINADDYYGKEAFRNIYQYLEDSERLKPESGYRCAMAGFVLENTLSANGTVTRGVCLINEEGKLIGVNETQEIGKRADGVINGTYQGRVRKLEPDSLVSMNFWGFTPDFMPELEQRFVDFLKGIPEGDLKAEYLLPVLVNDLLKEEQITVRVLPCSDQWFGITYPEDKDMAAARLQDMVDQGIYPSPLW